MSIFSSIFRRKSELEKVMKILNQVDQQKLKQDINNCFKFERMKQRFCTQGSYTDKLYLFFSKLTILNKDVYKKAKNYFKIIEREAKEKQITNTKQYVEYSLLVSYMVDLAKVYDFFNERRYADKSENDETNIQIMKSLVKPALYDSDILFHDVTGKISKYSKCKSQNNKNLVLYSLISAIKQIADRTKEYVEHCADPLFEQFGKKYKPTYDALSKIDVRDKAWRTSSKSQVDSDDLDLARIKIGVLHDFIVESGKFRELEKHFASLIVRLAEISDGT